MSSRTDTIGFHGQVILVTGAARGLGRAYAEFLASRGATLVLHDAGVDMRGTGADPSLVRAAASALESTGATAAACAEDLSAREGCERTIAFTLGRFGRLDALVHSAGLVSYTSLDRIEAEDAERILRVNIAGPMWLCRAALPIMYRQAYGRIVLTVSGHGLYRTGAKNLGAYSMSKAAQMGLMHAIADEGEAHGVRANAISPVAATRMYRGPKAPGEMTPEQVAPAVAYLASRDCEVSGTVVRAANGRFSIGRYLVTSGIDVGRTPTSPEQIRDRWQEIAATPFHEP